MGRGRALEALLGADVFLAERYGWINRARPDGELAPFVARLAKRVAGFPRTGVADAKRRVNEIALPPLSATDGERQLFEKAFAGAEAQLRTKCLVERGFQTDGPLEKALGAALGDIPEYQARA